MLPTHQAHHGCSWHPQRQVVPPTPEGSQAVGLPRALGLACQHDPVAVLLVAHQQQCNGACAAGGRPGSTCSAQIQPACRATDDVTDDIHEHTQREGTTQAGLRDQPQSVTDSLQQHMAGIVTLAMASVDSRPFYALSVTRHTHTHSAQRHTCMYVHAHTQMHTPENEQVVVQGCQRCCCHVAAAGGEHCPLADKVPPRGVCHNTCTHIPHTAVHTC